MLRCEKLKKQVLAGEYDGAFACLYPQSAPEECRRRYAGALDCFLALYGDRPVELVSAPGRTEIGGNHTDHQRGRVLAAAVNLDILCVASPNAERVIRIQSEGYPGDVVPLEDLSVREGEKGTASALIRGIASWFSGHGYPVGGLDAYTTSDVLGGSGLSSSAAFEVAVGNLLKALCGGGASPVEIALAGQYAENSYFGKPSGLMDQTASSVGGFVEIDFADPLSPRIRPVRFDFASSGYALCIVDTKGSHANLTAEYAAIFDEMRRVSGFFGKQYLREVDEEAFYQRLPEARLVAGDRAVLRAIHFFNENALVPRMARALEEGDFPAFLEMSIRSGRSSFTCLQNVSAASNAQEQGVPVALALSEMLLAGRGGAWRVHGGGFAGTIQAFVPGALLPAYRERMSAVFGPDACHVLTIRPVGGVVVRPNLGEEVAAHG